MNHNIIIIALSQYGISELVGSEHNPEVLKYFSEIGHDWVKDDETAWCSAFANWVAKKACCEHSGHLNARSWLDVGADVFKPKLGDVVVLWRENRLSWKGHVGFYIRDNKDCIYVLGGNQSNRVCIHPYPKGRLLSYRRLGERI